MCHPCAGCFPHVMLTLPLGDALHPIVQMKRWVRPRGACLAPLSPTFHHQPGHLPCSSAVAHGHQGMELSSTLPSPGTGPTPGALDTWTLTSLSSACSESQTEKSCAPVPGPHSTHRRDGRRQETAPGTGRPVGFTGLGGIARSPGLAQRPL